MRSFTVAALTLLVSSVSAQTPAQLAAQIPACVLPCDSVAIAAVGCSEEDLACHCQRSAQIQPLASPCLLSSSNCTKAELQTFGTLVQQICVAVNATAANSTATAPSTTTSPLPTGSASILPIPYTGEGARLSFGSATAVVVGTLAFLSSLL